ncbi:MAG: glucosidase [Anaerolineae bacterium]
MKKTAEHKRLESYRAKDGNWKHWGPYLSDRAWGTVREDYSSKGDAWDYLPHEHARSRAYRWNEDGLAGISDRHQYLCFAPAFWNGRDPILKERMFGLTGPQGNHGEDAKELWYYLDSTPTHSYMKALYRYPQAEFPYADLINENQRRGFDDDEFELLDTGIFGSNRYFDIFIEYAKGDQNDILVKITAHNRGDQDAPLHILPTVWFRNTWSWGYKDGPMGDVNGRPQLSAGDLPNSAFAQHPTLGDYHFYTDQADALLFTENETNNELLFNSKNASPYVKDGIHRAVIDGESAAVNPEQIGTKLAAVYAHTIPAGGSVTVRVRLTTKALKKPFAQFDSVFKKRLAEADEFYAVVQKSSLTADEKNVQRQALAGMLWSKQLYYYDINQWLNGDPDGPPPPKERKDGRNKDWSHLVNFDIISMPDKWEYPWYATWDLAFHTIPLVLVDPDFAKRQLTLTTREWYMHPNGQLPAYEWAFGDVNPPVHAWAAWRVYKIDAKQTGKNDRAFLEGIFHKLLLNFTWWVNRKDTDGNNIFQGGFLGLDNISVFDRSHKLPTGGHLDQADGTAWMGAYCLQLLRMALELSEDNPVYEDMASKFFEHFLRIASAMNNRGHLGYSLWDDADGFFYDSLHLPDGKVISLKVRSLVGLLPIFAIQTFSAELLDNHPVFKRRMDWFMQNRPDLSESMVCEIGETNQRRHIAALLTKDRLTRVLKYLLDESEFLSDHGIRSLSKVHEEHPYVFWVDGTAHTVPYWPAESRSGLFGGNSNWRGPIWFPMNYLIIEALQQHAWFYGDGFKVEMPTGSGNMLTLNEVAEELSLRLTRIFLQDENGRRPVFGDQQRPQHDDLWRNHVLFYEYFHGDNGAGLGASHQTGWTGLVAKLIQQSGGKL